MDNLTTDLLSRIETLEARLRILEATGSPAADAATRLTAPEHIAAESSSRRELLRYGAVALGATAAAGLASPVEAQGPAPDRPLLIDRVNSGGGSTLLTTTSDNFGFYVQAVAADFGLAALSSAAAIYGQTSASNSEVAGVIGVSTSATGLTPGVYGIAYSPNAPAVYGRSAGGGNAVRAEVPTSEGGSAIALYALNYSSYAGGAPGAGGFAIYGLSAKGHGLVGATAAAGAAAVVGATNGVAGAYAGAFYGPLIVSGNFTVVGGAKSAAVPHPDGSHRRLYCVESPESWFEDFGSAKLICGEAVVPLDRDFAAVVDTSEYHVFLTANDGPSDLWACDRTSEGFRVKGTTAAGEYTFSWRVVAKRRDIVAPRFETVDIPKEPTLPDVPASATATEPVRMPPLPSRPKSKA